MTAIRSTGRCVVFDIDDTLYLERDYVRSGFRAVGQWAARELGIPDFFERAWDRFSEGTRGTIFNRVLEAVGRAPGDADIAAMVAVYRAHRPDIELLADARACLERLRGKMPLGVVTDGPLESQRAKAGALGLAAFADPIVFTAELGAGFGKPHPRAFRRIERQTGLSGPACAYVADNPHKDFAGPKGLGWATIRVRRPGALHHDAPSGTDVDVERSDLSNLTDVLGL